MPILNSKTTEIIGEGVVHEKAGRVHILVITQAQISNEQTFSNLHAFPSEIVWTIMQDMTNNYNIRVGIGTDGKIYLRTTEGGIVSGTKVSGEIVYMS